MDNQKKIALLIDAENISQKYIKLIMNEIEKYGVVTYKRVYGDFTNSSVLTWKSNLVDYAMTPVFQFNYTKGKNASDSAMVIDAMDILYSGKVSGFCLVTSDSDFTKLAIRLREAGMLVVGMGEQKTPSSLVAACETFKYLDLLYNEEVKENSNEYLPGVDKETEKEERGGLKEQSSPDNTQTGEDIQVTEQNIIPSKEVIEAEITEILNAQEEENGWVNLASVGGSLAKRVPGFDSRNYGYKKLKNFVESSDCFDIYETTNPKNELLKIVYIKVK